MSSRGTCPGCGLEAELETIAGPGLEELEALGARCLDCWKRSALLTGVSLVVNEVAAHPVGRFALTALEDYARGRRAREGR